MMAALPRTPKRRLGSGRDAFLYQHSGNECRSARIVEYAFTDHERGFFWNKYAGDEAIKAILLSNGFRVLFEASRESAAAVLATLLASRESHFLRPPPGAAP
jgi:hypothetical protein